LLVSSRVDRTHYIGRTNPRRSKHSPSLTAAMLLADIPTEWHRERWIVGEDRFAEIVIWRLPRSTTGSRHLFKYRLAFVVDEVCVSRFDNETGKGDHKHIGANEIPYAFTSLAQLVTDFWEEVERWRR
jgi:hypothetical protein